MTNNLLPLEKFFKKSWEGRNAADDFPIDHGDYYARYTVMKRWIDINIYKYIGAGTSAEDNGIYSDHSIDHFNKVIEYAGKLIGLKPNGTFERKAKLINGYEAYLILCGILLHDSGNVFGRHEHEKKTKEIASDMGDAIFPDIFEKKLVCDIAEVHGGFYFSEDGKNKDTIGKKGLAVLDSIGGVDYRPQLIAAIVRFADEICEDKSRSARYLKKTSKLPVKSEIYHMYALSIYDVKVDLQDKSIFLKMKLVLKDVLVTHGKDDGRVYLVDEIFNRLTKMNCERIYCNKFMHEICYIQNIKSEIMLYDDDNNVLDRVLITLKDTTYPMHSLDDVCKDYPAWNGQALVEKYSKSQGEKV